MSDWLRKMVDMFCKQRSGQFLALTAGVVLAMCLSAAAQDAAKPVQAVFADDITVDGELDEEAWQTGPWINEFILTGTYGKPTAPTKAAVRFDDKYLYYAVVCFEPDIDKLKINAKKNDSKVWRDDCVEFMLAVKPERSEFIHIMVNPAGKFCDIYYRQGGGINDKSWDAGAKISTIIKTDRWQVELAIPIGNLGIRWNAIKGNWAMLATRMRRTQKETESSTHIPNKGDFLNPQDYGKLKLDAKKLLNRFRWDVKQTENKVNLLKDGGYQCAVGWSIRNLGGFTRTVLVRETLTGFGEPVSKQFQLKFLDWQTKYSENKFTLKQLGSGVLDISVFDANATDILLVRRQMPVKLSYEPIKVTVTQPFYRNSIYATEKSDEIKVRVKLKNVGEETTAVNVLLQSLNDNRTVAQKQITAQNAIFNYVLPIPDLSVGTYKLITEATLPNGKTLIDEQTVQKLPSVKNEWRIDSSLSLLRNGKPMLPYGILGLGNRKYKPEDYKDHNAGFVYHLGNKSVKRVKEILDSCYSQGIYLIVDPYPPQVYYKNKFSALTDKEADLIKNRVLVLRDHPGIMGWYSWDEPDLQGVCHDRLLKVYNILKEIDPYHPVVQLPSAINGIYDWADTADVIMPDPYPRFLRNSNPAKPMIMTIQHMNACRKASGGKKPWWIAPQSFEWPKRLYKNSRCPDFNEHRCQQLQAFIGGARGLLWYVDRSRLNSCDAAFGRPFLAAEAKRLSKALLAPEIVGAVKIYALGENGEFGLVKINAPVSQHIHGAVRRAENHLYLFTVNTLPKGQESVRFSIPELKNQKLYVVSENRIVNINEKGIFQDSFGKYEGHIYTTNPDFASGTTLAEVQKRIDVFKSKLAKPGNLAHGSTGATIEPSSHSGWCPGFDNHMNDGYVGNPWIDGTPKEGGDYWQVNLAQPSEVGRIVVLGSNVEEFRVQLLIGEDWKTVYQGSNRADLPVNATFKPQKTSAVRFIFDKPNKVEGREIEIYEK